MKLSFETYDLHLQDPFTISRGTVETQPTLIVTVERDGLIGFGEATSNSFYGITLESMKASLEKVRPFLADRKLENPAELWEELDPQLSSNRFAQCALDCALWDLYAKQLGLPLWQVWGLRADTEYPNSSFTIGIDTTEVMLRKIHEHPDWPIYKIKLSAQDPVGMVESLRSATDVRFRVDANCGWEPSQVVDFADQLAQLNVEFIEQPLPHGKWEAMQGLKEKCALPLVADESCQVESDVDRCIDTFDVINIKLCKCGGPTPARRMIARAKQNGLGVMVGCMTESSIGISAGVHLLPLLDYADLDGAHLLREDIAEGLHWDHGRCQLTNAPGLGVRTLSGST